MTTPDRYRRQTTAAQKARWDQQRQARLVDLHARLVDRVATLTDGDQWRAWLAFATRFHNYSFNNTILIWTQRPDATWVAGIKRWNTMGRRIRPGEKGIAILAPVVTRSDPTTEAEPEPDPAPVVAEPGGPEMPGGRVLRGFRIVTVFDIAQTEGDPIDPPRRPGTSDVNVSLLAGQAPPGVWEALVAIASVHGHRVERGDCAGANGYINYTERLIKVRDDVDDAQAVKTLMHELGHVLLHTPTDFTGGWTAGCRGEHEVEAESVAFLTAAHVGLDTSDYSFGYVTGWAEQAVAATGRPPHEIVQATGGRVVRAATQLSADIDDALGHGEPSVPVELARRVAAGVQTAAWIHATTQVGHDVVPHGRAFPVSPPSNSPASPPLVPVTRRARHR